MSAAEQWQLIAELQIRRKLREPARVHRAKPLVLTENASRFTTVDDKIDPSSIDRRKRSRQVQIRDGMP